MKLKSWIIALLFLSAIANAQVSNEEEYYVPQDSLKFKDKIAYGMQLGTAFGTFNGGSYFSTQYSPYVSYKINNTWKILTGVNVQNYQLNGYPIYNFYDNSFSEYSGSLNQYTAYVAAQHKLSEKLIVSGELFYNMTQPGNLQYNPSANAFDRIGYAASFIYKVNDRLMIMGEFRSNDNYSPFRRNGLNGGAFTNFNQPFGTPFLNW